MIPEAAENDSEQSADSETWSTSRLSPRHEEPPESPTALTITGWLRERSRGRCQSPSVPVLLGCRAVGETGSLANRSRERLPYTRLAAASLWEHARRRLLPRAQTSTLRSQILVPSRSTRIHEKEKSKETAHRTELRCPVQATAVAMTNREREISERRNVASDHSV
jgi:hypothetical protein